MLAYPGLDPEGAAQRATKARARRRTKRTAKRRHAAVRRAARELPGEELGLLRRCSSTRSAGSASLLSDAERLRVERKVRNRLSAAASRKRKQDKVKSLESRVLELEKENTELRARMLLMERIAATGAGAPTQILPGNHVDKHAGDTGFRVEELRGSHCVGSSSVRITMEHTASLVSSLPSSPRSTLAPGCALDDGNDEAKYDILSSDGDSVDEGIPEPRRKRMRAQDNNSLTTMHVEMAPHAALSTSDSPCTSPEPEDPEYLLFDFPAVPADMGRQTSLDEDDLVNLLDCVQGITE